MNRKDDQSKEKMITHAWKLLGEGLIKYRGDPILLEAMSCCLRSLFSSLERVRETDGFSRTDGYNEYMVELSSALSVLFTTLEEYYQHPETIISAFEIVQYHGEISSPLGGTLSVLQKVVITLEGKMDDKPPNVHL